MITLPQFLENIDNAQIDASLTPGLKLRAGRLWFDVLSDDVVRGIRQIWEQEIFQRQQKFIIYGAGTFLRDVLNAMPTSSYEHLLVGFVDRRFGEDFSNYPAPVYPPSHLSQRDYELVVAFHPFAEPDMFKAIKVHAPQDVEVYLFYSSPPCKALMERETTKRIDALRGRLQEIED